MKKKNLILVLMLFLVEDCAQSQVLCMEKNTGAVFVRKTCKKRESKLDPVALGLVGPSGPAGPTGPQGPTGATGAQGSTGPTANIDSLTARVVSLESNNIAGLSSVMSYDASTHVVSLTGVNLRVANTNSMGDFNTKNGLGNIIFGYNSGYSQRTNYCSSPQYSNQSTCVNSGNTWGNNQQSGSHNLVWGGSEYTGNRNIVIGGLVRGNDNIINSTDANSRIDSDGSAIIGGHDNILLYTSSVSSSSRGNVIIGGNGNSVEGVDSTISGGDARSLSGSLKWTAGDGRYSSP